MGREEEAAVGSGVGGAQREQRIAAPAMLAVPGVACAACIGPAGVRCEHDLSVGGRDTGSERSERRPGLVRSRPGDPTAGPGRQRATGPPPGDVREIGRRPPELVDVPKKRVAAGQSAAMCHVRLQLGQQPVGWAAAGDLVEHVAYVEQVAVDAGQLGVRDLDQPGRGQRLEDDGVAETSAGLLEVGFEEERQLPEPLGPVAAVGFELGQPPWRRTSPRGEQGRPEFDRQRGVTGHVPGVEERQRGAQVGGGLERLVDGADAVVDGHPVVPQRVPQPFGHAPDVGAPGVVQQQEVEVAGRGQLALCRTRPARRRRLRRSTRPAERRRAGHAGGRPRPSSVQSVSG